MLTGKYDDGIPTGSRFDNYEQMGTRWLTEENRRKVAALAPLAAELGVSRAELALAWVLRQPGVSSVITGATRVGHVEGNLKAAELELDDGHLDRIDAILNGDGDPGS